MRLRWIRSLRAIRVLRVLRSYRLLNSFKGVQELLETLRAALPMLINLIIILCILFFCFGCLGVKMYGPMCVDGDQLLPGARANRCLLMQEEDTSRRLQSKLLPPHTHFRHLGWALLTLLKIGTGPAALPLRCCLTREELAGRLGMYCAPWHVLSAFTCGVCR